MRIKIQLVVSILSFVIQILGWVLDALNVTNIFGFNISFAWIGLGGSLVFAFFLIWMVIDYHSKLQSIKDAKPNLVLKKIDENLLGNVQTRKFSESLNTVVLERVEHPNFTRIWIANEPKMPIISADAVKVYAEIIFFSEPTKKEIFSMGGRWAETKEVSQGGQPIEIDQIDIPPNARPFCLDIGIKYQNEEHFYGYNNETPSKITNGFRDQDRQLGKGVYTVKIRFRCKGVDESFWFQLNNPGTNGLVSLKLTNPPKSLK